MKALGIVCVLQGIPCVDIPFASVGLSDPGTSVSHPGHSANTSALFDT